MGQQELKPGRWRVRCACLLELVAWIFSTHPACPVLDAGGAVAAAAAAAAADGLEAEVEVAGKGLHRAVVLGLLCCPGAGCGSASTHSLPFCCFGSRGRWGGGAGGRGKKKKKKKGKGGWGNNNQNNNNGNNGGGWGGKNNNNGRCVFRCGWRERWIEWALVNGDRGRVCFNEWNWGIAQL